MDNHSNTQALSFGIKSHPINTFYRAIGTAFCYLLFGLGTLTLSLALPLIKMVPIKKKVKRQWTRSIISQSCMFFLNTMKNLSLLSYSIGPTPKIAPKGKLIIANHPSLLDAFFILGMCKNLCCITKSELWKNPFTAIVVRMADYIPNNSKHFIAETKRRLERGENILIFPEGSRNSYDNQLAFKRGAANIAILTESDIIPILIKCSPRVMQKNEKFYSIPMIAPVFSIDVLPTIETKQHIMIDSPITLQYRQLTHYLIETYRPHLTKDDKQE